MYWSLVDKGENEGSGNKGNAMYLQILFSIYVCLLPMYSPAAQPDAGIPRGL